MIKSIFIEYLSYGRWKKGEVIKFIDKGDVPSNYLNLNFNYRASSKQNLNKPVSGKRVIIAKHPNSNGTRIVYLPKLTDLKKWGVVKVERYIPSKKSLVPWEMVVY